MISYATVVQQTEKIISMGVSSGIPQRPWIAAVASAACWYGRRVALTYAPGYLANRFIQMTILFLGSETMGTLIGTTVVAPMLTPSLVPTAAMVAGLALFYLTTVSANLVVKIISVNK